MKFFLKMVIYSTLTTALLSLYSVLPAAELIAPTRTLNNSNEKTGKLSVFSEPPQLEVILDGNQIGKTPVVLDAVKSGIHVLRIKESETQINIKPDKHKLSWYKGAFIEIPPQSEEALLPPRTKEAETAAQKKAPSTENKEEYLPLYWPLNPRGPIY